MPVRRQDVPLYGSIGHCRQHALAPNPYLVYLGERFRGDQPMYPQYLVAITSSRTDERHIQDDDLLLSKNRSTTQWPSIYINRQCNLHKWSTKKQVKYILICVNPQREQICIRPLKNHFTKNPKIFLTYFPLLLDLTWLDAPKYY